MQHLSQNGKESSLIATNLKLFATTFQLNASISHRQGKSEASHYIYSRALVRIHIIGGQRLVRIVPPSCFLHCCSLATWEFQPSVLVKAHSSAGVIQASFTSSAPCPLALSSTDAIMGPSIGTALYPRAKGKSDILANRKQLASFPLEITKLFY